MDKEIHIYKERAKMFYTYRSNILGIIPVRKKLLAAETTIKANRGQTLTEIAERLERIREIHAMRRLHRRDIWRARYKTLENP